MRPVISRGELVEKLPSISKIRDAARSRVAALPERLHSLEETAAPYEVKISPRLVELAETVRHERQTISL